MAFIESSKTKPSYDVIVVGSGAAGGQSAYALTMAGAKVLMLEAGRNYVPEQETPMFQTADQAPLMNPEQVAQLIRAGLPGADVRVESDDNTHFAARIVSPEFAGKRSLARHQLVYRALGERMGNEIHALSIEALTPEESGQR